MPLMLSLRTWINKSLMRLGVGSLIVLVSLWRPSCRAVKIARGGIAKNHRSNVEATLWGGTLDASSIEWAVFTNALMVRYLDYNDTYLSKEPLHPSDMIPALLAAAEYRGGLSGKDLVTAIATSYEIGVRLCDAGSLRLHGWDHVNYIALPSLQGSRSSWALVRMRL